MNLPVRCFAFAGVTLFLANACTAQTTVRFARYPAPSPDGKQIAFSWQGDLWLVSSDGGEAKRLTVHEGYDYAPVWSPDGSKIAFTSDRYGNDDVFVLNLRDGTIQRLTYWSGRDRALGLDARRQSGAVRVFTGMGALPGQSRASTSRR
jgi:Periplasmic component of the Tol biopolymer transport system